MYVAVNKNGQGFIFLGCPVRKGTKWDGVIIDSVDLNDPAFAGISWETDPVKVIFN